MIRNISYGIDALFIVCMLTKFVTVYISASDLYDENDPGKGCYMAHYSATIVEQCLQMVLLILSLLILYKIRTILGQRPVCQTGLCQELPQR